MNIVPKAALVAAFCKDDASMYLIGAEKNAQYIEIDRDARLYVAADGPGDRMAFAEAFLTVWQQIPEADRAALVHFWSKGAAGEPWTPTIALQQDANMVGAYFMMARSITFNAGAVGLLIRDGLLRDVIAHELGHALKHTQPDSFLNKDGATQKDIEDEADGTANGWGFNMAAMRAWGLAHQQELKACGVNAAPGHLM